jgi:elongation factor 1-beta
MWIQGTVKMGDVAIILKIMPESPDIDLEELKQMIRSRVPETQDIAEDPIGFGLSALKVAVVVPDSEGATDVIEETLRSLDGVSSAEIISLTLT